MRLSALNRRSTLALLRALMVLMLAAALLAPKISLAAAGLSGDGYRSVLICNGAQLLRVTVAPDGEVVSDVSEEWVAPHCVLTEHDAEALDRVWALADYPSLPVQMRVAEAPPLPLLQLLGPAIFSRGPPPG